jgi:hypothetical protein
VHRVLEPQRTLGVGLQHALGAQAPVNPIRLRRQHLVTTRVSGTALLLCNGWPVSGNRPAATWLFVIRYGCRGAQQRSPCQWPTPGRCTYLTTSDSIDGSAICIGIYRPARIPAERDRCSYSWQPRPVMATGMVVNCASSPNLALIASPVSLAGDRVGLAAGRRQRLNVCLDGAVLRIGDQRRHRRREVGAANKGGLELRCGVRQVVALTRGGA